jgi:hypothetical protein
MPAERKAIYLLKDGNGEPRYVGVASNPPDRLKRHLRECRQGNTYRKNWIRSMLASGHTPTMEVVEWTGDWDAAERQWIFKMRALGYQLTNGNEGGTDCSQWRGANCSETKTPFYKKMMIRLGKVFSDTPCHRIAPEKKATFQAALDSLRASRKRWEKAGLLEVFEFRMQLWYERGFRAVKEFDSDFQWG